MVCYVFPALHSLRGHVGRPETDHVLGVFIPRKLAKAKVGASFNCAAYFLDLKSDKESNNVG